MEAYFVAADWFCDGVDCLVAHDVWFDTPAYWNLVAAWGAFSMLALAATTTLAWSLRRILRRASTRSREPNAWY